MISPRQIARVRRAAEACKALGITQEQVAAAIGASQSQVSRILKAEGCRQSRLFEEVCLYVERFSVGVTAEAVRENDELIGALAATWDGSDAHARALSAVIRSLALLGGKQELKLSSSSFGE
jgi:predicted transcriptional regulator